MQAVYPKFPIGILVLSSSLRVIECDLIFCELFNIQLADIKAKSIDDLLYIRDRKGSRHFHEKVNQYQKGFEEVLCVLRIGKRNFFSHIRFVHQDDNWILYIEPLEREGDLVSQLYERQERWINIINNSNEGIAILDHENNLIEYNQKFLDLLQIRSIHDALLSDEAILKKNIFHLLEGEEFSLMEQSLEEVKYKKGTNLHKVVNYKNSYLNFTFAPLVFPVSGIIGKSLVINDLTAQRQSTRFGRIVDNSINEIYVFNAVTLQFVQVNLGARENLQFSMEELIHLTPLDLKPEYTLETFEELIKPLRENRKPLITFETVHKRKDGSLYPVSVRLQLMHDEIPPVFLAIIEDITQRKLAEDKLSQYAIELRRSNEELSDFAMIASHDLIEPLQKINSFSHLLHERTRNLDEKCQDYIHRIEKSSSRMHKLITDLLEMSKVTAETKSFKYYDLSQICKDSVINLESRIEKTQGKVIIEDMPSAEVDPNQMSRLFQNLIGNSLKYCREGIPPIVNIYGKRTENEKIEIVLDDNGIGFDEKFAEKIFQPFQRLHGKSSYEGTGMGLAICKKIIDRHHGTIFARSKDSFGATFIITIPERQKILVSH